jgi:5'-AMP-activated protein kinase, regulatory gamma subunit
MLYQYLIFHSHLQEALDKFRSAADQHRFAVVDASGKVLSILSQSQLVRSLLPYIQGTDLATKTVSELRLGYKPVLSIPVDAPASQAFKKMQAAKVTGLAVLDAATSKLVGSISASDLKEIGSDASLFERVLLPVGEFWAETLKKPKRRDSRATSPTGGRRQIYFVTPQDTIATVFEKFSSTRVHRLFVIDEQTKPLGVISLKDIIDQISKFVETDSQ